MDKLKRENGLALQDIISELIFYFEMLDVPTHATVYLLAAVADIE